MRLKVNQHFITLLLFTLVLSACDSADNGEVTQKISSSGGGVEAVLAEVETPEPVSPTEEPDLPGSISDWVWQDLNMDGLQDEDEPGFADVQVHLLTNKGVEVDVTVTDEDGYYLFEEVEAGTYALQFEEPEDQYFTHLNQGDNDSVDSDVNADGYTKTFELSPGEEKDDLDAGLVAVYSDIICTLTGLPIENDRLALLQGEDPLQLRPLLLSISQVPADVRPLAGLSYAPVVFETVQHDGDSRLQVLLYCGLPVVPPEQVGDGEVDIFAFRSGRSFYTEIADLFSAGLLYAGSTYELHDLLRPYTCQIVVNDTRNLGGAGLDITRIVELAKDCELKNGVPDMGVWTFGPPSPGGEPVEQFLMHYHRVNQTRWIYDAEAGGYVRYQNSADYMDKFPVSVDRLNGEPIVKQNILVLITEHRVLNRRGSLIEFDLVHHGGFGYLFRDGLRYKICWSAINRDYPEYDGRFHPFLVLDCATKEPINMAYGDTWVNVVDVTAGFGWEGEDWRAFSVLPQYQP